MKVLLPAGIALIVVLITVGVIIWIEFWDHRPSRVTSTKVHSGVVSDDEEKVHPSGNTSVEGMPEVMGHPESCLVCHAATSGLSLYHSPLALGCSSCHGGNSSSIDKDLAHRDIRKVPGNLNDAALSCGADACHPAISERMERSLMTTMSGVVTVDRWVFGEEDSLSGLAHIRDIGQTAADRHLRDLCANCHLGNMKTEPGPVSQVLRGGGCNACHLNYNEKSLISLNKYRQSGTLVASDTFHHPLLNLDVTNEHCFSCHSRSGRIATNYQGWHETLHEADAIPLSGKYRVMDDRRVFEYAGEDIHHTRGMLCIDCHNSYEMMGDGNLYAHKEQAVKLQCNDCHFAQNTSTLTSSQLDPEALKILFLRSWESGDKKFILPADAQYALVNAWADQKAGGWLQLKSNDSVVFMKPPVTACAREGGHRDLSCESCHTGWAPRCIGCHNAYDPDVAGYDMLTGHDRQGSWVEYAGLFEFGLPTLGIMNEKGSRQIITFVPGMILSIDGRDYPETFNPRNEGRQVFRRLYAPISAHTTTLKGRDCKSCHCDPVALGYGQGNLAYVTEGKKGYWTFSPRFTINPNDQLPEDAWIGFDTESRPPYSTRDHARPFTRDEQRKILTAGACLQCHPGDSPMMEKAIRDFPAILSQISPKCVLPAWDY
jgi:hypothetical protein